MSQHPEFQIIMVRSPHLTQEEVDRRLTQAFDIILNFSLDETGAPTPKPAKTTGVEAEDTPNREREQPGVYHDD